MSKPHLLRIAQGVLAATMCGLSVTSCADLARTGSGPSYLIMDAVQATAGGTATLSASLDSDVLVNGIAVLDRGQASIRVEMKKDRKSVV